MIQENFSFGIDLGIGSCGWAVLRQPGPDAASGAVAALGSWIFDVPETDKERKPTNQIRRGNRLLRRVIRRRRGRMAELRQLFAETGLLPDAGSDALKQKGLDPWELRARGLDRPLTPLEFAVALGHIAKRRGFKSSAKRKAGNAPDEDSRMLTALAATKDRLGCYRTLGEMFARDPEFKTRRRNRDGQFDRTAGRDDLAAEIQKLFSAQRRFGQSFAGEALQARYETIAFRQKEMPDSEFLVGPCPFEPGERRAARMAPSFEAFRLLTRLINLRITTPEGERPLRPDELARATADLGKHATLTVKRVRDAIGLPVTERFTTIKPADEGQDITARKGEALPGTAALRKSLGEDLWPLTTPEQRDRIAHVLSFFETNEGIAKQLGTIGLAEPVLARLRAALDESDAFAKFKAAGHISAKAARNLLPHLAEGKRYDQACALVGYDHAASSLSRRDQVTTKTGFNALVTELGEMITNPIARKALTEGLKQLWALRNSWGLPGSIVIELARDVGNSIDKRRELEAALEKTPAQRKREREEAREALGGADIDGETLLRYRLWKEQGGRCLYTDQEIHLTQVIAGDNSVQVDHILPWSRFGDDSFNNKTLCLARANQGKKNATPFEWFLPRGEATWAVFTQRIETNKMLRGFKKRNFLLKNAKEAEEKFRSRNLNDTRYAARLLAEAVKLFYPPGERQDKGGNRRIFTRPGGLTAALRQAWGLEALKKVDGKRLPDDRHHALDALVLAAVTESEVQKLTKSYQECEQRGLSRPLRHVPEPWPGFRDQAKTALAGIFVARPERRRARGEGHAATIRQVKPRDGETIVFERKSIISLKAADLERIKDPERSGPIIEAIQNWIAAGRPADAPPRSKQGDVITKVRLRTKIKPAVPVRGGTAERGDMVRVDVFSMPNRRGKDEFYLVPIYPHQVMNRKEWPQPPMRAIAAYKDETEWKAIDHGYQFRFSLYPRSFLEVVKPDGLVIEGYFSGIDRSTGAINLMPHNDPTSRIRSIGAKTLLGMTKFQVDRFGNRHQVKSEVRTWHGVACISPSPPD